jgi:Family of unknown function (DUF5309)
MSFTGKATYSAGVQLPEIAEDVSDLVSVLSPTETPLLDLLGEARRYARSSVHEWIEETALVFDINVTAANEANSTVTISPTEAQQLRVGDLLRLDPFQELVRITAINNTSGLVTLQRDLDERGQNELATPLKLIRLSRPTLEGATASNPTFGNRQRCQNFTQIFASTIDISGSLLAVQSLGVRDEMEFQKTMRLRELLRQLEAAVLNGAQHTTPVGSNSTPRSMQGIRSFIKTHRINAQSNGTFDAGPLTEAKLNAVLRRMWEQNGSTVDTIVVSGREKRAINSFISADRRFVSTAESFKDLVSVYESDFGVCKVVMSRFMEVGSMLLLDSSRVEVLPLAGRNFHFKKLAPTGDSERGQVIGEYTLELRNEAAHAWVFNLDAA